MKSLSQDRLFKGESWINQAIYTKIYNIYKDEQIIRLKDILNTLELQQIVIYCVFFLKNS